MNQGHTRTIAKVVCIRNGQSSSQGNRHMASWWLCNAVCFHATECGSLWKPLLVGDVSADVFSNGCYR